MPVRFALYNSTRGHSTLGNRPPANYEKITQRYGVTMIVPFRVRETPAPPCPAPLPRSTV